MAQDQQYGGFWVRLVALVLDNAIVFFILLAALLSMGTLVATVGMESMMDVAAWLVMTFVPFLYWPVLESSHWQATFGKRIMGLEVTDADGNRLSFLRALLRSLAKIISSIPLGLGFVLAAFTARKQALHDIIVKTLVVRTGPSHLWKVILALIVGFVLMVASAAGLFYYVVVPMFKKGFEDPMKQAMKGAPQMKTIPAPAAKAPPASRSKPEAPAPAASPAPAAPVSAPAPAIAAPVKPEAAQSAPAPAPAAAKSEAAPKPARKPRAAPAPEPMSPPPERPAKPGPKFNDVMTALLYRDPAGVNELLDMGRWIDKPDSFGFTPLMVAVRLRDAQMAQLLLGRGADPNARAAGGVSPLTIARANGDAAMAELLQKSGAR